MSHRGGEGGAAAFTENGSLTRDLGKIPRNLSEPRPAAAARHLLHAGKVRRRGEGLAVGLESTCCTAGYPQSAPHDRPRLSASCSAIGQLCRPASRLAIAMKQFAWGTGSARSVAATLHLASRCSMLIDRLLAAFGVGGALPALFCPVQVLSPLPLFLLFRQL